MQLRAIERSRMCKEEKTIWDEEQVARDLGRRVGARPRGEPAPDIQHSGGHWGSTWALHLEMQNLENGIVLLRNSSASCIDRE